MDIGERKARILYGQYLTNPSDAITVCKDLNGVQAQFMSAAIHALFIRATALADNLGEDLVKRKPGWRWRDGTF